MKPCRYCERGAVLITGMMMLTLLAILLSSVLRTSALSLAHAASLRSAARGFDACDQALRDAMQASVFMRAHVTTASTTLPFATRLTTTLQYLGSTDAIPHPQFDAARHASLDAHYFEVTATATGPRSTRETQQQVFLVIADAATPANVALARNSGIDVSDFGDSVIAMSWRRVAQ